MDQSNYKILQLIQAWKAKSRHCCEIMKLQGRVSEEDLKYHMPDGKLVVDYGLVFSHEPFKWKLPELLRYLWNSTQNECIKLSHQLINFEQKKVKSGGIADEELVYICYIKNIIHYVMKNKFMATDVDARKVIGGDLKDKSHFTVKKDNKNE